ncbi:hypothetical protein J6590_102163, partial [Homalodisca vitripennis]
RQDCSAVTHPSSNYAPHCLTRLSCDNHHIRYTTPLTITQKVTQKNSPCLRWYDYLHNSSSRWLC